MISELFFISSLVLLRFVCYQLSWLNVRAECTIFLHCQFRVKGLLACDKKNPRNFNVQWHIYDFLMTIQIYYI